MGRTKCNNCIFFKKIRRKFYEGRTVFICDWQDVWYLRPEGDKKLAKNRRCNYTRKKYKRIK